MFNESGKLRYHHQKRWNLETRAIIQHFHSRTSHIAPKIFARNASNTNNPRSSNKSRDFQLRKGRSRASDRSHAFSHPGQYLHCDVPVPGEDWEALLCWQVILTLVAVWLVEVGGSGNNPLGAILWLGRSLQSKIYLMSKTFALWDYCIPEFQKINKLIPKLSSPSWKSNKRF